MNILIVEDELATRKKLEKIVQVLGYETLVAEDGLEGWKIWEKERPGLVITDWIMPGMDGLELCGKIKEAEGSRYTYIIMVTSKKDIHDIITGLDAGADDFISKPFVKEELAVRIRAGERVLSFETRLVKAHNDLTVEIEERRRAEGKLAKQRDHLEKTVKELEKAKAAKRELISELQDALAEVKQLSGLLPICSHCKKIRDDEGYWKNVEEYITHHSEAEFSHSICPECLKELYPKFAKALQKNS